MVKESAQGIRVVRDSMSEPLLHYSNLATQHTTGTLRMVRFKRNILTAFISTFVAIMLGCKTTDNAICRA